MKLRHISAFARHHHSAHTDNLVRKGHAMKRIAPTRLTQLRRALGWTQAMLAKQVYVSVRTANSWERDGIPIAA